MSVGISVVSFWMGEDEVFITSYARYLHLKNTAILYQCFIDLVVLFKCQKPRVVILLYQYASSMHCIITDVDVYNAIAVKRHKSSGLILPVQSLARLFDYSMNR